MGLIFVYVWTFWVRSLIVVYDIEKGGCSLELLDFLFFPHQAPNYYVLLYIQRFLSGDSASSGILHLLHTLRLLNLSKLSSTEL